MSISIGTLPTQPTPFIRQTAPQPAAEQALPLPVTPSGTIGGTTEKAPLPPSQAYAVSDKTFSLFKDASGQVITRYVSLLDGSITYTPEPTYVRPLPPPLSISV